MANSSSTSINWITADLTFPTVGIPSTTTVLNIDASPVATLTIPATQYPLQLPNNVFLQPNVPASTVNGIMISVNPNPPKIYFQRAPATPQVTSHPLPSATSSHQGQETVPTVTSESTISTGSPISPTATGLSPKSKPQTSGLGKGAAAGLAIGCLIAGALIAGLILWFCSGRKKRSRGNDYEASSTALVPREKGFAAQATSLGSGSPNSSPVSGALPLPLEDKAITGEISKISNSIKNHVQSYYHTSRVNHGVLDLDDIQAIGHDLPISVGTLSTLLGNSATREIALRFCIAWVVCTRIQSSADPEISFLPIELATCSQRIECAHRSSSGKPARRIVFQSQANIYSTPSYSFAVAGNDSRADAVLLRSRTFHCFR
jgi:hypothetical protein